WMEHLEAMDYLRSSVNLRAYGQREPIVEYKKEGLFMFKEMEETFKEQVFSLIETINTEAKINISAELSGPKQTLVTSHNEPSEDIKSAQTDKTVGRNDPCPCGSGKKYKKCHGT
ncbi:MAG: SEC-C metal-binding domain-containing protein, partial [Patescibacteria group bacterium]